MILSFFFCQSCINTSKNDSLEENSLRKNFLVKFETLLQNRYQDKSIDPLKQLIVESNEKYPQIVFIDSVSQLGDSIWDIIYYDDGSNYCIDFDGWYCGFMQQINNPEPWVKEYMDDVCSAKDISPIAVIIILEKARLSSLKGEKVRLLLAVHFTTLMLRIPLEGNVQ